MESSPSWELILCEDTTHLSAVVYQERQSCYDSDSVYQ